MLISPVNEARFYYWYIIALLWHPTTSHADVLIYKSPGDVPESVVCKHVPSFTIINESSDSVRCPDRQCSKWNCHYSFCYLGFRESLVRAICLRSAFVCMLLYLMWVVLFVQVQSPSLTYTLYDLHSLIMYSQSIYRF